MTAPNVQPDAPDRERRRAADLRTGDRIIGNLLNPAYVENVAGVYPYPENDGQPWVLLVVQPVGGLRYFVHFFRADYRVFLAAAAEPDLPTDVEGVAPGAAIGRATVPTEVRRG